MGVTVMGATVMDFQAQLDTRLIPVALDLLRLFLWLILLVVLFRPAERLWALRPRKLFRKAFGTDVIYYFLNGLLPKLLLLIPLSFMARAVHHFAPSPFYNTVALLPFWLRALAALVAGELGAYWGHRWSHEIPWLWSFHSIHHAIEEVDWLAGSHAHPIDMVFVRLCGLVPVYALGLAQPSASRVDAVPVLVVFVGVVWGFFIHANVKWRFGWLEWLVSSPAFHHWHHTNDSRELIDKNYASLFPWVDKVFGTHYLPCQWPSSYGIDEPSPRDLGGQLWQPLAGVAGKQPEESHSARV